jgi:hypothetical protein
VARADDGASWKNACRLIEDRLCRRDQPVGKGCQVDRNDAGSRAAVIQQQHANGQRIMHTGKAVEWKKIAGSLMSVRPTPARNVGTPTSTSVPMGAAQISFANPMF